MKMKAPIKNGRKRKRSISPEAAVIRAVDEYLTIMRIPHWRINSGAYRTERGGYVRFGAKGMADVYAIGNNGVSVWIECKRPEGGRLSEEQREFLDCINRHGGVGIVVSSIDSLAVQLKEAGVI
jgi:hypothetical protein